jgi:hypothetical protein
MDMTVDELRATLGQAEPPFGLAPLVRALWLAGHGDWSGAHAIAQDVHTAEGAWVHAHLHRQDGDAGNAAYWYGRAHRPVCKVGLDEEWSDLVRALLVR